MSSRLYEDAIADAKHLREVAEQNAKNAIIESVTPRIREFIEEQLMNESEVTEATDVDNEDIVEEIAKTVVGNQNTESIEDEVTLDESAVLELIKMLGGQEVVEGLDSQQVTEFKNNLNKEGTAAEISKIVEKLEGSDDENNNTDDNQIMEKSDMSNNDDSVLYEIDLNELIDEADEGYHTEGAHDEDPDEGMHPMEGAHDEDPDEGMHPMEEGADDVNESDDLTDLSLEDLLNEASLRLELGDVEIDPTDLAVMLMDDEEEEDDDDIEAADTDDEVGGDVEVEDEEAVEVIDEVEEAIYEIDETMLREELAKLMNLSEAADMVKQKGIKNDMADHFGGKGSGQSGDDFGGGKRGSDPLKVTLNKLSEAVKNERRKNRSLTKKLSEYRSAVETLREQMTDLNLFNAKLLYVNKLLQNKDVTATQRKSIIESLDSARSLREVKLLYKSLTESMSKPKTSNLSESTIRRTLGSSSRATSRASADVNGAVSEVNRWAKLAGLTKK